MVILNSKANCCFSTWSLNWPFQCISACWDHMRESTACLLSWSYFIFADCVMVGLRLQACTRTYMYTRMRSWLRVRVSTCQGLILHPRVMSRPSRVATLLLACICQVTRNWYIYNVVYMWVSPFHVCKPNVCASATWIGGTVHWNPMCTILLSIVSHSTVEVGLSIGIPRVLAYDVKSYCPSYPSVPCRISEAIH